MTDIENAQLWEILVPCNWNDGLPVRTRHHREWDRRVMKISGGLTVLPPGHGQWDKDGHLYRDRMIPVRVMCTRQEIMEIARMTIGHYEQLAVMYHLVSKECTVLHASTKDVEKFVRPNQGDE